jgi:tRNA(Arg) A34 adenosine deaminase TadA
MTTKYTKYNDMCDTLKKMAQNSDIKFKHAAMLIKNNIVYASGFNQTYTNFSTIHAEISVFTNYPKRNGSGLDILVIRVNKKMELRNSRPCNSCIVTLGKIGIRKIFYSNDAGEIICEYLTLMEKTHVSSGTRFKLSNKVI